jgi:hypothetical protein
LAILVLVAILPACTAPKPSTPARPTPTGPPARVDIGRALTQHPFAAVLAQYDVDIATLRDDAGTAAFQNLHRQLESNAAAIADELARAAANAHNLRTRTIGPALSQGADFRQGFGPDTLASFRDALQTRTLRAHDLRAMQLREHEANVALAFERAHAGRRLVLEVKLHNLYLDEATYRTYRAQLASLDAQEEAALDADRRHASTELARYDAQLRARSADDAAAMSAELANHARAMQSVPRPAATSLPKSIAAGHDERPAALAAFDTAHHDLTGRFGELAAIDDRARSDARAELAALVRERDALRAQIIASIEARARRIATAEHLGQLYFTDAPSSARDITDAVLRALR